MGVRGSRYAPGVDHERLTGLLDETAAAVAGALDGYLRDAATSDRERGERPGQYRLDLVTDEAALGVLRGAGVDVLSEESGFEDRGAGVVVVVDPVDGSTNASRGLPWYAVSLCAVDDSGPVAALVQNLATGRRYAAVRERGATCDGVPIRPSTRQRIAESLVVINGHPPEHLGWRQYRSLGASALDLCSVADGRIDGSVDCTDSRLGPWDYLAAALVIEEAGGHVADAMGRDLVVLEHSARRTPVAAGTPELLEELLELRSQW